MESLCGYLIAGAFLAVGIWLRFDDWRAIERHHAIARGGNEFTDSNFVFADTGGVGGGCGHDAGCTGS